MKCPFCRSNRSEVYNSRNTKFGTQVWRRRRCLTCQKTFTTYESPDLGFLHVNTTSKQSRYSRAKLFSSVYAAFNDVKAKDATIDAVTDTIESKLLDTQKTLVTTDQITAIVLSTLKHFNGAAYLKYLGSHSNLASPSELRRALKQL